MKKSRKFRLGAFSEEIISKKKELTKLKKNWGNKDLFVGLFKRDIVQKYIQDFKNKFPKTTSLLLDHPIQIGQGWPYHSTETFNNLERIFMDSLVTMVYKSDKLDSSGRKKYIVDVDKEIHSSQSVDDIEHDSTEESLKSKPFVDETFSTDENDPEDGHAQPPHKASERGKRAYEDLTAAELEEINERKI